MRTYDIKDFNYEDFEIKTNTPDQGWFICTEKHVTVHDSGYMHKDCTIHDVCGSANFFESYLEAYTTLNMAFGLSELPEELFEI
jgi:hypothetical protein